jgi:hypothetical protein
VCVARSETGTVRFAAHGVASRGIVANAEYDTWMKRGGNRFSPARIVSGMKNDEYEKLATAIWQGNTLTIAALQDMTADDLHEVEKAIADLYRAEINLNSPPEQIRDSIAKARSHWGSKVRSMEDADLDQALREANAEDS